MATATTTSPAIFSLFSCPPTRHIYPPPSFLSPNFTPKLNPRLRISHEDPLLPKQGYWAPVQSCCYSTGNAGFNPEITDDSSKESSIDIKLPRRSLLVQFTCNSCGERTKRMINRVAYEGGTVFVQCSGCLQHHKLIDNLNLVVEYDFRNDIGED